MNANALLQRGSAPHPAGGIIPPDPVSGRTVCRQGGRQFGQTKVQGYHAPAGVVFALRALCFSFLVCFALTGCAALDYDTAELTRGRLMTESEALTRWGVERDWWKGYGDAQLNALEQEALANNTDLAKSAISVNKALYQARRIGSDLVPAFTAGADAGRSKNLESGHSGDPSYGADMGLSYELDLWRRLRDETSAAEWALRATEQDLASARLTLTASVADAYFNWRYTREAVALTEQSLKNYERILAIAEARNKQGKTDGLEPLNARQSVLSARNSLMTYQTELKTIEQTLRDLLNRGPGKELGLSPASLLGVSSDGPDLNVPLAALSLRPDVRAAEFRLQSAFRSKEATEAALYPSITVGATLSASSDRVNTMFDVPFLGGTIKINLPFLQWNKLRWDIKTSEAEFEEAKLNLENAVNTALNEVDALYFSYRKAQEQMANMERKLEADTRAAVYREERWKNGAGELQDWLNALNTRNSSLLSLLKNKYDLISRENAIYRALGGRLTERPAP